MEQINTVEHSSRQAHATDYGSPLRNLCADILLLAMTDVQPPKRVKKLARCTSSEAKELLSYHRKAVHYFTHSRHKFLCSELDLDPVRVKKRALSGLIGKKGKQNEQRG